MLGIGAGEEMNITPYGIEWNKPLTRLKEAVEVIKKLWAATPASPADYTGESSAEGCVSADETPAEA